MYKKEPIKDYEEYQVDTNGRVYSKRDKPLKYSLNHNGYCIVNLLKNGQRKGFGIHTLVAKQFIENVDTEKYVQVNHKDGNKQNNNVNNLEWVTCKENVRHAIEVLKKDNKGKNNVRSKRVKGTNKNNKNEVLIFDSLADAGRYFCKENRNFRYAQNSIHRALNGLRKSYKGYYWEYI